MNGDTPSMADPNSMMPQQQQPIPQGPTVQATPASTNSLADLANLLIPALAGIGGAKYNKEPALLGGLAGAGMGADAMQTQRANALKYQQMQDEREYRQTTMMQAQENIQRMKMVDADNKKKIAFRDQAAAAITDPIDKELFLSNPTQWSKMRMIKESKAGDVAFIVKASRGKLDSADVAAMSDETRHALAVDLAKGIGQNKSYSAVKVPLDPEKGTYTWMLQDQKGDAKFVPGRDIQGGQGPAEEKGKQTEAQKIHTAQMLGAQWEKLAEEHRMLLGTQPPEVRLRWERENPKEDYIVKQTDLLHRVALKGDKQADKEIEKTTLAKDAEIDFDSPKLQSYFQDLQKKYPKMTVAEMITKYKADHGIQQ